MEEQEPGTAGGDAPLIVELTWAEVELATFVGAGRRAEDRQKGRFEKNGVPASVAGWTDGAWERDINATMAEVAAAKALGRFWSGINDGAPDLFGGIQVRQSDVGNAHLLLQKTDNPDQAYLLVVGPEPYVRWKPPRFRLVGWVVGWQGQISRWWRDNVPRPCFWVPQEALNPDLSELRV